jgi:hypothetical protein
MLFARTPLGDPAADAARFLCRLACFILFIVAPCAEVFSLGLLYVLFPVGAAVLIIAGLLVGGGEVAPRRLIAVALTSIGMAVAFLAFWSGLSLIWTPFPGDAAARLARTLLTAGITLLAIMALPERSKISNIYLLPAGVAVTAVASLLMMLFGQDWFRQGATPDSSLAQRCIMSIVMLLWPALGALALRERFIMAVSLACVVAAATLAGFVQVALLALMAAALTYVAAMSHPQRIAKIIAIVFVVLLLAAPLFVAVLYPILIWTHLASAGPIGVFADLVVHEWPRFVTGHGLDMVERGIDIGLLPQDTPRSFVFVLWYELGVVGVAGFVFFMTAVLLAVAALPQHAAPAYLALLVTGLVIGFFGAETMQLWWLSLNGIAAVALAILAKAHPRAKRPLAPAADADEADIEEVFEEDAFETYPETDF